MKIQNVLILNTKKKIVRKILVFLTPLTMISCSFNKFSFVHKIPVDYIDRKFVIENFAKPRNNGDINNFLKTFLSSVLDKIEKENDTFLSSENIYMIFHSNGKTVWAIIFNSTTQYSFTNFKAKEYQYIFDKGISEFYNKRFSETSDVEQIMKDIVGRCDNSDYHWNEYGVKLINKKNKLIAKYYMSEEL